MSREPINYTRVSGVRSSAIVYISVEGEKTEDFYFKGLNRKLHDSRLQLNIVGRDDPSHSAPKHVLQSMLNHKKKTGHAAIDRHWIVIDRDRWPVQQLQDVIKNAEENNIEVAFSNPCFELWLLFHICKIASLADIRALNSKRNIKDKMVAELRRVIGAFNVCEPDIEFFFPRTNVAIENAGAVTPKESWFESAGTTMHELMKIIMEEFPR